MSNTILDLQTNDNFDNGLMSDTLKGRDNTTDLNPIAISQDLKWNFSDNLPIMRNSRGNKIIVESIDSDPEEEKGNSQEGEGEGEGGEEEETGSSNMKRKRKQPTRFTIDFGKDSLFGKDVPLVTHKDRASKKRAVGRPKAGSSSSTRFNSSPGRGFENAVPFEGLNGRDLDLEKTFPFHIIDSAVLSSRIEECAEPIDHRSAIHNNQLVAESSSIYPILASLHGPVACRPCSDGSSGDGTPCQTRIIEEYYLLPQPYHHKNNVIFVQSVTGSSSSKGSKTRFPPITLWEMPYLFESHIIGCTLPIKVTFFSDHLAMKYVTGYILSTNRNDDGYLVNYLDSGRMYSERKQPFAIKLCALVKEDWQIVEVFLEDLKNSGVTTNDSDNSNDGNQV